MADQIEELIREIAAKHGIAVARDDPILVLQTINNRLLQDGVAAQQAQLSRFKEELEAISLRWQSDAKDKAERVLNQALISSKNAMQRIMHDSALETVKLTRSELDRALTVIASQTAHARQIALLNLAASCLTITAAIIAVYTMG